MEQCQAVAVPDAEPPTVRGVASKRRGLRCAGRTRRRRSPGGDQQPGQADVPRAGRQQARPSATTSPPNADHAHRTGSSDAAAALPERGDRLELLPEADPRQRPGLVADDDRVDAERHDVAGDRDADHAVGRQPRLPQLPTTVPDDPDNTDERIDLDPSPGVTFPMVQEAAAEVALSARRQRHHLRRRRRETGLPSTCTSRVGTPFVSPGCRRRRQASAARRPDLITDKWWKESAAPGVHRLQPERSAQDRVRRLVRPAAPSSGLRPVRLGGAAGHPPRRPHRAHRPRAHRIRGDPYDLPSTAHSIAPLVERYERDLATASRRTWPPVYPKMPDEARW